MTPTKEQIEAAAIEYGKNITTLKNAFSVGANWALQQVAPQWISVEERLPIGAVNGVSVFVQAHNEMGLQEICAYDSELKTWTNRKYGTKITHWMPLPEPPQQ